ncbi:heterokaryon incompatibility protein-domain-containing protein [Xylariomycetidae sp. FL2044]|nr:heterokaryon incompatibility protein-domain-containing protein [Xylariomycetidae sp. FL2044]
MHLLQVQDNHEVRLVRDFFGDIPAYAILSHTWGSDQDEITYQEMLNGTGTGGKSGLEKIKKCGAQARTDGLEYFWVDTCCIDKTNSTELSEAINSMFRWYQNAAKCYVYLADVDGFTGTDWSDPSRFTTSLYESRWFTRGWTLQELLAPPSVEFFTSKWERIGDKRSLEKQIHETTGIAEDALRGEPLSNFSVDKRMSWAESRTTKREEDMAYCLLGIFGLHMPLIYGEGRENALKRLKNEIQRRLEDNDTSANHPLYSKFNAAADLLRPFLPGELFSHGFDEENFSRVSSLVFQHLDNAKRGQITQGELEDFCGDIFIRSNIDTWNRLTVRNVIGDDSRDVPVGKEKTPENTARRLCVVFSPSGNSVPHGDGT